MTAMPPATDPGLRRFREILIWPVKLRVRQETGREAYEAAARLLAASGIWAETANLYGRDDGTDATERYSEFVYFHPFVQNFLYGDPPPGGHRGVRLFRRSDVSALKVVFGGDAPFTVRLDVARLHLYLFEVGVAVLVLELNAATVPDDEGLTDLAQAQILLDRLRRVYPPFFRGDEPGTFPEDVRLFDAQGRDIAFPAVRGRDFADFVANRHQPPVAGHWQHLLAPLQPVPLNGDAAGFSQILDERMPLMAWLAFRDPRALTEGDFARLCFADGPGTREEMPYAPAFLYGFAERFCYDAHWHAAPDGTHRSMTTRYLCSGFAFVVTGIDDADMPDGGFFVPLIQEHFRRHYFQLGLIAHFHNAALLAIEGDLSEAMQTYAAKGDFAAFAGRIERIHRSFLQFTNHYWFPEVSNQMQARRLSALWNTHLDTGRLFTQVQGKVAGVYEYIEARRTAKIADQNTRIADDGRILSWSATILAPIAVVASLYGADILVRDAVDIREASGIRDWLVFGWLSAKPWANYGLLAMATLLWVLVVLLSRHFIFGYGRRKRWLPNGLPKTISSWVAAIWK